MPKKFHLSAFQLIAFGFSSLILLGTLLLMLPISTKGAGSASFPDALFTAVSSVCVTGLIVQDTATYWSIFGQAVILLLIQIGGMGVVTIGIMFSFITGKKIGFFQRNVMQESISAPQVGGIVRLTRFIVLTSISIESIGAILLLPVMITQVGLPKGIWYSVFHSVSAFCNAGFDLMGYKEPFSSFTSLVHHPLLNIVLILLISIGGIGFLVWQDFREHHFRFKLFRLQSKIALLTSCFLVFLPAILFFFEMKQFSIANRFLPALFQSVTMRTAGFNTVDLNEMSSIGKSIMILLMLIGGSPGSTAGGMKTTTFSILIITAFSVFNRKKEVACLGRRVSDEVIRNSVALLVLYGSLFFFTAALISSIESIPLLTCLFETASAVGTVGVTLGITSHLCLFSRFLLIILMFLGRVGGLTLIYAAQNTLEVSKSTLPLEKITVG